MVNVQILLPSGRKQHFCQCFTDTPTQRGGWDTPTLFVPESNLASMQSFSPFHQVVWVPTGNQQTPPSQWACPLGLWVRFDPICPLNRGRPSFYIFWLSPGVSKHFAKRSRFGEVKMCGSRPFILTFFEPLTLNAKNYLMKFLLQMAYFSFLHIEHK